MAKPYLPKTSETLASFLGITIGDIGKAGLGWRDLGLTGELHTVQAPQVLFKN